MDSQTQGNLPVSEDRETVFDRDTSRTGADHSPAGIWVLGAGRFGRIAGERLATRYPRTTLLVVDHRRDRLARLHETLGIPVQHADAIDYLSGQLLAEDQWIVPAVPVHVAWLWLVRMLRKVGPCRSLPVPERVDGQVPNPFRVASGTVYASFATFRCPDDCIEPARICTHTGQPRLGNLFDRVAGIEVPAYHVEVIRSWQLAPGVGGYRGKQLHAALQLIQEHPGRVMVATSCRCHGVIDALSFGKR